MTVTPAGWYPDPNDASLLRYWDGQAWTESTSPAAPAAPAAPVPPAPAETGGLPSYPDYSGGYGQQQAGFPSPYAQPQQNDSNVLSIIGIVCGAIAFLFCPPLFGIAGLILGGIAMSKKERLAKVALIVSGLGLVLGMVISFVVFNSM